MSEIEKAPHYNQGEIETIGLLEDMGIAEDFCLGNAIKYLMRYKHKDTALTDLQKARWYVNKLIKYNE